MKQPVKDLDAGLMRKYGQNAHMYVEYPHKSHWTESFGETGFKAGLESLCTYAKNAPTLLYVHMPYCQKQCYFCTCRVEISLKYEDVHNYLQVLYKEIDLLKAFFDEKGIRPNFKEIHLGGGTPTYINEQDFDEMMVRIRTICDVDRLAEFSIEIDPRRVKRDRMKFYHDHGINRISFGIQDFDLEVQKAVNRVQPASLIEKLLTPEVRGWFKNGVNFDIICGLPNQTVKSIRATMEKVSELAPDRVCFNYLDFAPKFAEHQLLMPQDNIPGAHDRKALFIEALDVMTRNGYVRTGYDHFAKPKDDVAKAMEQKKMIWNSLGSTPGRCVDIVGIGVHSYSRLGPDYYSQNFYELEDYENALNAGRFPVFRGCHLTDDDVLRRDVIQQLRSYFSLDQREIESRHKIDFKKYFKQELEDLKEFEQDRIVELTERTLKITDLGQQFANLVCRNFDRHAGPHGGKKTEL